MPDPKSQYSPMCPSGSLYLDFYLDPWCLKHFGVQFEVRLEFNSALQVALVVDLPVGDAKDAGSIPGSGRSPGGGHGNPLRYSCLENPMDRGA